MSHAVLQAPVTIRAQIGAVQLSVAEVLELGPGDLLDLDHEIDMPIAITVNGQPVARGELVELEGGFAVRVTSLSIAPVAEVVQ